MDSFGRGYSATPSPPHAALIVPLTSSVNFAPSVVPTIAALTLAILPLSLTHLLSKRPNMLPTPTKIGEIWNAGSFLFGMASPLSPSSSVFTLLQDYLTMRRIPSPCWMVEKRISTPSRKILKGCCELPLLGGRLSILVWRQLKLRAQNAITSNHQSPRSIIRRPSKGYWVLMPASTIAFTGHPIDPGK